MPDHPQSERTLLDAVIDAQDFYQDLRELEEEAVGLSMEDRVRLAKSLKEARAGYREALARAFRQYRR